MKCPNCGLTAKSLRKGDDGECPDCGEALKDTGSRTLLQKDA